MKPTSNTPLWATNTASSKYSNISSITSSIVLALSTSFCVMCVKDMICAGNLHSGLINICLREITSRFFILTAPNSMILSKRLDKPVVSRSNTTNVQSSNLAWLLLVTILYSGSTMLISQPYNI